MLDHGRGGNGCATRRQFVEHTDFEIAVHGHCCSARNRRGSHDQHIRRGVLLAGTLAAQGRTLLDTKAVLLVDHHHTKRRKRHTFLNQCVRADGNVNATTGHVGEQFATTLTRDAAGEELDPQLPLAEQVAVVGHAQVGQQSCDAGKVLFGQHFGGRHECTLVATLHCCQHCSNRHHRFAAAHVALQQPVHRHGLGQIHVHLVDHTALRTSECKRQRADEALLHLARHVVANAGVVALKGVLAAHQHQLHAQQFVERQAFTSLLFVDDAFWKVDDIQRRMPVDHFQTFANLWWQRVADRARGGALQRVAHPTGKFPRGQVCLFALRIDRHDSPRFVADDVDHWVDHLHLAAKPLGLAEHCDLQVGLELSLAPRLVEERERQRTRGITHQRGHHAAFRAQWHAAGTAHLYEHQRFNALD